MKRKPFMRLGALLLVGAMLFGVLPGIAPAAAGTPVAQAAEVAEEFSVAFVESYAVVGEALNVKVQNAASDAISYRWEVDGVRVGSDPSYTPTENDLMKWISVTVTCGRETAAAKMFFSKLPVVYINTENGAPIVSKVDYINADLIIQGNETYNSKTTTLYNGLTEIRGRGNSTWGKPKNPYKLKLDKKTDLFGMGKNKHWVLLANYMDESLMRNTLAYDLSGAMGMEHMSTVYVDVVLNGEFVGNYQFCEQVRVDSNRVDVFDWESFAEDSAGVIADEVGMSKSDASDLEDYMLENMGWITSGTFSFNGITYNIDNYPDIEIPSINGGYLLELDEYYDEVSKFKTSNSQPIMFKSPEFANTNQDMMNFVQTYIQAFENAVRSNSYTSTYDGKTVHYSDLYDFDALVDYWLVNEIFFNEELNKKSTYMYKDIDGLMTMGPVWDMDWSSNGQGSTNQTNQWATRYFSANAQANSWYKNLIKDPYFFTRAQERYWEIRDEQVADMLDELESNYDLLKESAAANVKKWGYGSSFEKYVGDLRTWLNSHLTWMDTQMATQSSLQSSLGYSASSSLTLTLADADGKALAADDISEKAPADGVVTDGQALKLTIKVSGYSLSGNAVLYVNGRRISSTSISRNGTITVDVPSQSLSAQAGEKDVIEVKIESNSSVRASRYLTVLEYEPCEHEHTELRGAFEPAFDLEGYTGDLVCLDCGKVLEEGTEIPPTGGVLAELKVSFAEPYAVVGQALNAEVEGADPDAVTYAWTVDGKSVGNNSASYTPTEQDLAKWISVTATRGKRTATAQMFFSKLPVVYINTENSAEIVSKEDYINADLIIQGNETYNSKTSTLYNGLTEIRGRGNSTWSQPKKPYKLKLDKKTDLFGMGKNKHWVLLANYLDESLMRNTLAYDLSGAMGMEQMSTVYVDVILNGDFIGNYQFCEQVRVDSTRVDVFDWESFAEDSADVIADEEGLSKTETSDLEEYMLENMGWITSGTVTFNGKTYTIADYPDIEIPSINGGYLLELDEYYDEVSKFHTSNNQPIMFKSPEFVNTNQDMMNFVKTYVQAFENAVRSDNYTSTYEGKTVHYSDLYDFDSLVDYWLVNEIFFNEELNKKSTYMYKDIDGKMIMGPVWDMDWSSGGEGSTHSTDQWATRYFSANAQANNWYKNLIQDPYFFIRAQERYWEIRNEQVEDMLDELESNYDLLKESAAANGTRWGYGSDFKGYVDGLHTWLNSHLTWMDTQMTTQDGLRDSLGYYSSSRLGLTLADADGKTLAADDVSEKAPADGIVSDGQPLQLNVQLGNNTTGTARLYINGRLAMEGPVTANSTFTVDVPGDWLTAELGQKDVLEVQIEVNGAINASRYVTVLEYKACEHENTEIQGAVEPTADAEGYTGDLVCSDCGAVLEEGTAIASTAGDVDMDGSVTVADIAKIKMLILAKQWSDEELARGDLNKDGKLDVVDIMLVKNMVLNQ